MRNNVIFSNRAGIRFRNKKPEDLWMITGEVVCHELSEYIDAHEAAGIQFDTECQEVVYDARVTFVLRKVERVWIITDVLVDEPVREYLPVFIWKRVRQGAWDVITKVLAGWRVIRCRRTEAAA